MPLCDTEGGITFKENTKLQVLLVLITACIMLIAIAVGIPVKVLVLLIFSISMTFFSVFLMVWCFAVLEEKRILAESKKEFEKCQQAIEHPQTTYNSTDDKERVKNNP